MTSPGILEEDEALLGVDYLEGGAMRGGEEEGGETFDDVPKTRRRLGLFSAIFLISNRIIGTGIFATPSIILRSSGSVGMSLMMWLSGALVACAGTAVYLELGTGLPRSGGEKVYLEFIFRKPKYLVSSVYALIMFFMAASAGGAVIFGEYALRACGLEPTPFQIRTIAAFSLFFTFVVHSCFYKFGVRLQNTLGVLGLLNLTVVATTGVLVQLEIMHLQNDKPLPRHNFEHMWEGTRWEANALVTALYSIIWSFIGYSNANYVLSEMRDPIRTIKKAAPIALTVITATYLLVNVSYFVVVDKYEILASGQGVAALFFRNVYGEGAERILDAMIALSTMGNLMSTVFSQGRVMQELGREDMLPFASVFASSKPFNAPTAGLFQQAFISCLAAVLPPPGDAFAFVLNLGSYPYTITNVCISAGLIALHTPRVKKHYDWSPPFVAWRWVTAFFLVANVFLLVAPFIPPDSGAGPYQHLPYWIHSTTVMITMVLGIAGWYVRFKLLPRWGHYTLRRVHFKGVDGVPRANFRKVHTD